MMNVCVCVFVRDNQIGYFDRWSNYFFIMPAGCMQSSGFGFFFSSLFPLLNMFTGPSMHGWMEPRFLHYVCILVQNEMRVPLYDQYSLSSSSIVNRKS